MSSGRFSPFSLIFFTRSVTEPPLQYWWLKGGREREREERRGEGGREGGREGGGTEEKWEEGTNGR